MKNIFKYLLMVLLPLAAISLAACSDDDPDNGNEEQKNTISLLPPSVTIEYDDTDLITVKVETEAAYFVQKPKEEYDWVTVLDTEEGFSLKPTQNDTEEERTAIVIVSAENADPVEFTLVQKFFEDDTPGPGEIIAGDYSVYFKIPFEDEEYEVLDYSRIKVLGWEEAYKGEGIPSNMMYAEIVSDLPFQHEQVKLTTVDINYLSGGEGWLNPEYAYDVAQLDMVGNVLYKTEAVYLAVTENSSFDERVCELTISGTGVENCTTAKLIITQAGKSVLDGRFTMEYFNPLKNETFVTHDGPVEFYKYNDSGYDYIISLFGAYGAYEDDDNLLISEAYLDVEDDRYWFVNYRSGNTFSLEEYVNGKQIFVYRTIQQRVLLYQGDFDIETAIELAADDPQRLELKVNGRDLYTDEKMTYNGTEYNVAIAIYANATASEAAEKGVERYKLQTLVQGAKITPRQ